MENIVVGEKGCTIDDVWIILSKSQVIKEKWSNCAGYLRIPYEDIETLRHDRLLNKINNEDILRKIFHLWVADQGSGAKLTELIRVVEECGDNSVGETLRLAHNLPCKNFRHNSKWAALSPAFQEKVLQNISYFFPNIAIEPANLQSDILFDLMTGKKPKLFKSTVLSSPKFYLKRTLLPRHTISDKIFEADAPDIFLFIGLNEFELGRLVKKHETSSSGQQLDSSEIHVRFMVLEQMNHFKGICNRVSSPVHVISYDSNCKRLKWIQTHGRINNLQRFVEDCQNPLTEEQFLESQEKESNGPVLISDSPGMGKTFLLGNIALELHKIDKKIVIFTTVSDFMKQFKLNFGSDKTTMDSVKVTLQNLICNNELGLAEFPLVLSASDVKIELLMDGFDEISTSDAFLAMEVIKLVRNAFKSIRLWISTRPHYLEELEAKLNVLGYNIKGFGEDDQINFLKSHWQHSEIPRDIHDINHDKLTHYANKVLQIIKSQLNKDDNDIAGIPLQCLLIGEVFEEESVGYACQSNHLVINPKIRINSISDLYKGMVAKKLQKYLLTHVTTEFAGTNYIMDAHVDLSLKLLFPDYHHKLNLMQINIEELLKVGILQATSSFKRTEFIHRTFAEYFVATYVVEQLYENAEIQSSEFVSFFIDQILMRKSYLVQILPDISGITSYKFAHQVIGYFVNANINFSDPFPRQANLSTANKTMEPETQTEIYHACANSSFLQIFKLFVCIEYSSLDEATILLAIRNSTREFFKFTMYCLGESIVAFKELHLSNFLRVAVQRSDLEILNFLLKNKTFDFRQLIENANDSTKLLLHDCVSNTKYKPDDDIEQRVSIIQLLFGINPELLEERDGGGRTPLLCEYVHVDLLKELFKLGAEVNSQDVMGDTVLHLSKDQSRRLNAQEYHSLITTISKSNLINALIVAANDGDTPLMRLLSFIEPKEETLDILYQYQDDPGQGAFRKAIENGRNLQTLKKLVNLGVDITFKGGDGEGYIHMASRYGNLDALQLVIGYDADVNLKDNFLQTPMDYAILSRKNNRFETAKALHSFGGRASEEISLQQQHLLNKAIEDGNAQTVRIIREILKYENGNFVESGILEASQRANLSEEEFKVLVKEFVDMNKTAYRGSDGRSLFHLAAIRGDELAVKELVENGADFEDRDFLENTPLHAACYCEDLNIGLRIIKFMVNNGANVFAKNGDNLTFLDLLVAHGSHINPSQFHEITEYMATKNLLVLLFSASNGPDGSTALHLACEVLEVDERTILLLNEKGVSFNQLNDDGHNALIHAISGGRSKEFLELLINKCNADWKQLDKQGTNGLHIAAYEGHLEAQKVLMNLGIEVNQVESYGNTPLHYAVKFGKKNILETARILVKGGTDCNKKNGEGQNALEMVLLRRPDNQFTNEIRTELVKLLEIGNTDITNNMPNAITEAPPNSGKLERQNQELLLHKAVVESQAPTDCLNVIKSLISTEIDVYLKDQDGDTFLHKFVYVNTPSPSHFHAISKYLLDIGHKALFEKSENAQGAYVLHLSLRYFEPKLETLLLFKLHGINFNRLDTEGNSVLAYSTWGNRRSEFLSLLINEFGVGWKCLNNLKENLLHTAARMGNENALKFFINLGLDINARDLDGYSPIHHAIIFGDKNIYILKILQVLLSNGANMNSKCNKGETPLHTCTAYLQQSSNFLPVIQFLIENGADVFAEDNDKLTFLANLTINANNHTNSIFHQLLQYLFDRGYYKLFHTPVGEYGGTLAHHAVSAFHLELRNETLSLLYSTKSDINLVDNEGYSSLSYAVSGGNRKLCQDLVDLGADYNLTTTDNSGESLLHIAARRSLPVVELCLELGLDVNRRDNFGGTPLHEAVSRQDNENAVEIIKYLVTNGADPNVIDCNGNGVLHKAAKHGLPLLINALLKFGLDVSCTNNFGSTPIHVAASRQDGDIAIEVIKCLIENGADVFALDNEGFTFLHIITFSEDFLSKSTFHQLVQYLAERDYYKLFHTPGGEFKRTPSNYALCTLEIQKETLRILYSTEGDINYTDIKGYSSITFAIFKQGRTVCQELVDLGADINQTTMDGQSLLNVSAIVGKPDVVELLIELGLDVNSRDNFAKTPLHRAASRQNGDNSIDIINCLVTNGADPSAIDRDGNGAIHMSAMHGVPIVINALLKFGLDVNLRNNFLLTPLHVAACRQCDDNAIEVIKCLFENGADPNPIDEDGNSPVSLAINQSTQCLPIITCLIDNGAKVDYLNFDLCSYIHSAAEIEGIEVLKFFLDLKVLDVNAINKFGDTPLHYVMCQNESDYVLKKVRMLVEYGADVIVLNKKGVTALDIAWSRTDWEEEVKDKLNFILKIVYAITFWRIEKPLWNGEIEADCTNYNLSVLKSLIRNQNDLYVKDHDGFTFVHKFLRLYYPAPSHFHHISKYLLDIGHKNLLETPDSVKGATAFHLSVLCFEPELQTLQLFKSNGINFNRLDDKQDSILWYAIVGHRSSEFISLLINEFDVDWKSLNNLNENLLHTAAKIGNEDALKFFVNCGLDINQQSFNGHSPMHYAILFGDKHTNILTMLQLLLDNGSDINSKGNQGETPLHCTAYLQESANFLPVIQFLVDKGADVFAVDNDKHTFLYNSTGKVGDHPTLTFHQLVKYLFERGYYKLFHMPGGEYEISPAQNAMCNLELWRETLNLLYYTKSDINLVDNGGYSSLSYAVGGGSRMLCQELIDFGADINLITTDEFGRSLLHIAARNGLPEVVQLCLELGLDVNSRDKSEGTPLLRAASRKDNDNAIKIIDCLVANGADTDALDCDGNGILHMAAKHSTTLVIKALLKLGLEVNLRNNCLSTPLHSVACREDTDIAIEVIKCLIQNGADPNSIDENGNSPVSLAIKQSPQCLPIISCLIDNGANVHYLNFDLSSYVHLASEIGGVEVLKYFLDKKVLNINAVNKNGDTPLHCALKQKESDYVLEKVELLVENGADVNITNKKGETLLDYVEERDEWAQELKDKLKGLLALS